MLKERLCDLDNYAESYIVECIRGTSAIVASTKHGHFNGLLLHPDECFMLGCLHAGSSWAGEFYAMKIQHYGKLRVI